MTKRVNPDPRLTDDEIAFIDDMTETYVDGSGAYTSRETVARLVLLVRRLAAPGERVDPDLRARIEEWAETARVREADAASRRLPAEEGRSVEERLWSVRAKAMDDVLAILAATEAPREVTPADAAMAELYVVGHRHGVACGVGSAGLGTTSCEHVGSWELARTGAWDHEPRPAGPWTGDPADYDGDEGR